MKKAGVLVLALLVSAWIGMAERATGSGEGRKTLSPIQPRVIGSDFFGIHFHRLQLLPNEQAVPTDWPALDFGMLRLWDSRTRWADIEPNKGDWRFGRLDYYVNEASARGVKVLYTLGSTPQWASARPEEGCSYYPNGCSAEPRSMEDWREYVRVVARRYRGKICCYEVWNEPDFAGPPKDPKKRGGFYTGSVAGMVEMTRIAREVLGEEDPEAILFSPAVVNGPHERLDKFLAAGGREHVQGIAYHFYAWNDENRMLREIEAVRAVMQKNGLAHLPLWSTEAGVEVHELNKPLPPAIKTRITREEAAALMARQVVLAAFAGLDKYFYYAWDSDKSGMVDRTGRFHPSSDTMLLVQRWLIGSSPDRCEIQEGRPTVCWGEKDAKPFAIVWNPESTDVVEVPVPMGLHMTTRQVAVPRWIGATQDDMKPDSMLATPNPAFYTFERTPQQ